MDKTENREGKRETLLGLLTLNGILLLAPLAVPIVVFIFSPRGHYPTSQLWEHIGALFVVYCIIFAMPLLASLVAYAKERNVWLWFVVSAVLPLALYLGILAKNEELLDVWGIAGPIFQLSLLLIALALPGWRNEQERKQNMATWTGFRVFCGALVRGGVRKVIAAVIGTVLLLAMVYAWRVASYSLPVAAEHLAYKNDYLQKIAAQPRERTKLPNIVLILFDDMGYGDIGVYGAKAIKTPHIDQIAKEGVRLTSFYSASPMCSPSRAGLLTGRYPPRTGVEFILFPSSSPLARFRKFRGRFSGLPADEITIADGLQAAGYATMLIGKWHLGDEQPSLPGNFGFDEFYGVYCSNDMKPMHLYRNEKIIVPHPVDQSRLTENYTAEAIKFFEEHRDKPFFLYLPHTFPHIPLYPSEKFCGTSLAGEYGDVVEDLDRSIGEISDALQRLGLADNTLLIITSDNGPWYQGNSGSARGRKFEVFDGGMRVPFIARWPQKIPAHSQVSKGAMAIDLLPSIFAVASIELPDDRFIDGTNIIPLLQGKEIAQRDLYFYWKDEPFAIRNDKFKYHLRRIIPGANPIHPIPWASHKGPWLFDLSQDEGESYDVSKKYPKVFGELAQRMQQWQEQFQANSRGWQKSQ